MQLTLCKILILLTTIAGNHTLRPYEESQLEHHYQYLRNGSVDGAQCLLSPCTAIQACCVDVVQRNAQVGDIRATFELKYVSENFNNPEILVLNEGVGYNVTYRLRTPLLVRIFYDRPVLTFNLSYVGDVDWAPYEEVFSKRQHDYRGCYTEPGCSTCGMEFEGVPYSEGFCCSCVDMKNKHCPQLENATICDVEKREAHYQIRGGQDCDDLYTPPGLDSEHYHLSAHCLRYSGINLSVYEINEPDVRVMFDLRVFRRSPHGHWTRSHYRPIILTGSSTHIDVDCNLVAEMELSEESHANHTLGGLYLIVPSKWTSDAGNAMPMDPKKFLVVQPDMVGDECDKIGITYRGFARQEYPCWREAGTCLKNQPKDLFRAEMDKLKNCQPGDYFLQHFVDCSCDFKDMFKFNAKSGSWELRLPFLDDLTATMTVQEKILIN